jgi:FKBP-type peptidyl-prolyl cis-trans isomerase FkpA/FKBP-type peptidyl-prolyl cis-trans isomerase FklB
MKDFRDSLALSVCFWGCTLCAVADSAHRQAEMEASKVQPQAVFAPVPVAQGQEVPARRVFTEQEEEMCWTAIGYAGAFNMGWLALDPSDKNLLCLLNGVQNARDGKTSTLEGKDGKQGPQNMEILNAYTVQKAQECIDKQKREGEAFLKEKAKESGVAKTDSGLLYKVLTPGNSIRANIDCTVDLDYEIKLVDGKILDSSMQRGEIETVYMGALMPGVQEVLKFIGEGGEIWFGFPSDLGMGDETRGGVRGGSTLTGIVKLRKINDPANLVNDQEKAPDAKVAETQVKPEVKAGNVGATASKATVPAGVK